MVVSKLIGGLGNQLFQYAFSLHVGHIHNCEVFLDVSEFETYNLHKYALSDFNINEKFLNKNEIKSLTIFKESSYFFDPKFKELPDNVLLMGYWQSEKYFSEIKDLIVQNYSFKKPLFGHNKELSKLIQNTNSVSVHVRRADYLPNSYKDQVLECLDLEYYESAIKEISNKIINPTFFVFSDDSEWVKSNLIFKFPHVFVDNNTNNAFEDLRLMSLCCNNIIANSSFSWWGAWLNRNEDKIIISPKNWFSKNALNLDSRDLIPNTWIRI